MDPDLFARWKQGDSNTDRQLHEFLLRHCRRLGPRYGFLPGDAEDLAGDLYVHLTEQDRVRLQAGEVGPTCFTWLLWRVRGFLSHARRRAITQGATSECLLSPAEACPGSGDATSGAVMRNEFHRVVTAALLQLPTEDRESLVSFVWEGEGHRERACRLGMTPAVVRKRYERARRRFGRQLEIEGYDSACLHALLQAAGA